MAVLAPFNWFGNTGEKVAPSAASVAAARKIAEQLGGKYVARTPQNLGEGIDAITAGIVSGIVDKRALDEEAQGKAAYAEQFNALGDNPDRAALMGVLGNDFGNDGQDAVTRALLAQNIQQSDPTYQLDLDTKKAQLDRLLHPVADPYTLGPDQVRFGPDNTEVARGPASPTSTDPTKAFNLEKDLWSQYVAADPVKQYQTVKGGYQRVRASITEAQRDPENSGAADISLIFAYMKMLDPTSVVREGEQASAQNAGGVPDYIRVQYNQLIGSGGKLTDRVRQQFGNAADALYAQTVDDLKPFNEQFTTRATDWGVNPANVIQVPEAFDPIFPATATTTPGALPSPAPDGTVQIAPGITIKPLGPTAPNPLEVPGQPGQINVDAVKRALYGPKGTP